MSASPKHEDVSSEEDNNACLGDAFVDGSTQVVVLKSKDSIVELQSILKDRCGPFTCLCSFSLSFE